MPRERLNPHVVVTGQLESDDFNRQHSAQTHRLQGSDGMRVHSSDVFQMTNDINFSGKVIMNGFCY